MGLLIQHPPGGNTRNPEPEVRALGQKFLKPLVTIVAACLPPIRTKALRLKDADKLFLN